MLHRKNIITACHIRLEHNMDVRVLIRRLFETLDLIQHLFTALRPLNRFLAVKRLELCDDLFLVLNLPLLVVILL